MSQDSRQFSFFSTRDYRAAISQAERVRVIIRGEECALAALPSNGRHFHNNDSCILSASRLITLSLPLKKCSFVKIDAFTPPPSPLLSSALPPLIAPSLNFTTKGRRLRRGREMIHSPSGWSAMPWGNLFKSSYQLSQSNDMRNLYGGEWRRS